MRKICKRGLCAVLCICLLLTVFPVAFAADQTFTAFTAQDKLVAKGTAIYNQKGEEIALKGINLGGWLVYEEWMCQQGVKDNATLLSTLENRFGEEQARSLITTYWKNWITEDDLDHIAEMGFNCVRIPFWYRDFQNKNGEWYLDANGKPDLSILEWVVSECCKRGLYVILDLHGAPGGQSTSQHTGTENFCKLYDDTAEGEQYRAETAILWKEVAARFKDSPNVAAYDLLNEPTCDMNSFDYRYQLWTLYNQLYCAVRKVDPSTILAFEGIWQMSNLPSPSLYGWQNVIYEQHFYDYSENSLNYMVGEMVNYRKYYNVPAFVGECNYGSLYPYALQKFCENGIGFLPWSYKGVGDPAGDTKNKWFLYSGTGPSADVTSADYAELMLKWSVGARTEGMTENTEFVSEMKTAVATKSASAASAGAGTASTLFRIYFLLLSFFKELAGKLK